ncbi:MAG: ASKHA domain-containing protein [Desulfobacterales bacterium]
MDQREDGWVKVLKLPSPSLQNNTADADRLITTLKKELAVPQLELTIDLELLQRLPLLLRENDGRVCCTLFKDHGHWVLVGLDGRPAEKAPLGLAVDLGTTRVVLRIVDLVSGSALGEAACDNPQIRIGPDILARIHYADSPGGLEHLQQLIREELNRQVAALCLTYARRPQDIQLVAVAGNTAMSHLLLGLSPHWMIREPYIPVTNRPGLIPAAALGLQVNPRARVFVFPNIGSYFGGDLIAGILYAGLHRADEPALLVDVGTNAEVVLGNSQWLMACAGAAGPALESGVSRVGTLAAPGAIDRVRYDRTSRRFELHAIADRPPHGICGSGLIDLAAQLFLGGLIDFRGRFRPRACDGRLVDIDGTAHLIVVPAADSATGEALTISQTDLDSLIRSKAAMYTILETITGTVGIRLEDITTFYVAGTFGTFIQPASAIAIGMLPDLPLKAFKPLGNSSLGGATLLLTAAGYMEEIDWIRDRITYLELNVNQEFMTRFSAARFLPHTDRNRFPSVHPAFDE